MHISTCISSTAFTAIAVGKLNAVVGPSGVTRVWQTLVDITFTALSHVTWWAYTLVASNAVHTLAIIKALRLIGQLVSEGIAVIQINLTVDTYEGQKHCEKGYSYPHCYGHLIIFVRDFVFHYMCMWLCYMDIYLVFLWDRSTCMCWWGRCRCLHSGRAETGIHWSLLSSLHHGSQGHTDRTNTGFRISRNFNKHSWQIEKLML